MADAVTEGVPARRPSRGAGDIDPEAGARPRVGVVMGSDSDLATMEQAVEALERFDVAHEVHVVSAHRDATRMLAYGKEAACRGLEVLIAGAGGAAHLPGMLASVTSLPVIGVPVPLRHLDGLDSLLSIVQMPAGIPVATVAVGGARNAGLLAVRILAAGDTELTAELDAHREELREASLEKDERVQHHLAGKAGGFGFAP
ncbi:MAG: 5-(carboxyamino)imidazole ribonucleotide mutase [Nitriliruptoraceae bacterium]